VSDKRTAQEKYEARKAAYEFVRDRLVQHAGMTTKQAEKKAREVAEGTDNKRAEEGKE
jgi:hypothetical protein